MPFAIIFIIMQLVGNVYHLWGLRHKITFSSAVYWHISGNLKETVQITKPHVHKIAQSCGVVQETLISMGRILTAKTSGPFEKSTVGTNLSV